MTSPVKDRDCVLGRPFSAVNDLQTRRTLRQSPDTCHLNLAGFDVVGTLNRYKHRIHFLDYKDSKWTTPSKDWVQPTGKVFPKDSYEARFFNSSYNLDLGRGTLTAGAPVRFSSVHVKSCVSCAPAFFRACGCIRL
jgi:hypothetical protein